MTIFNVSAFELVHNGNSGNKEPVNLAVDDELELATSRTTMSIAQTGIIDKPTCLINDKLLKSIR